jgi:hypothetical protein
MNKDQEHLHIDLGNLYGSYGVRINWLFGEWRASTTQDGLFTERNAGQEQLAE